MLRHSDEIDLNKFVSIADYLCMMSWFVKTLYASFDLTSDSYAPIANNEMVLETTKPGVIVPCDIRDIVLDNEIMLFFGEGLIGEEVKVIQRELFRIYNSVITRNPAQIRCWGVISGLVDSYIICRVGFHHDTSPIYFASDWPAMHRDWSALATPDRVETDKFLACPLPCDSLTTLSIIVHAIAKELTDLTNTCTDHLKSSQWKGASVTNIFGCCIEWYCGNGLLTPHPVFDEVCPPALQTEESMEEFVD